jgi:hypothetical protein
MATSNAVASQDTPQPSTPQQTDTPDNSRFGLEFGVDQNMPFSTPYVPLNDGTGKNADEKLQEVWREESEEWGPTVRQLVTMRRMDGQARALYRLLTLPIRSALSAATFIPAEGDKGEADFIELALHTPPESGGMTVTFHRFMSQMLMALFDGFSPFEKIFWKPNFGPLQGKVTLMKIAHRPPETVSFITDSAGGFAGLRQRAYNGGKTTDVFIPREYSFYYAAQEEERKFYGISFFQSAFYHYDKKVKLYYISHLAAQRSAVGTRAGTFPQNATQDQKRDFAAALNNLSLAQWMMMPENFKVEIMKEGGGFDFLSQINHHNSQMSKSILAGFFDENQGAGSNDGTLVNFAAPGDDMFIMMLRAIMDDIANQINHYIIPQLIDFNFKGGNYPTFSWGNLTEEQKAAVAKAFDALITAKPESITPEFVRAIEEQQAEEYGLEIDYDEVEKREEAAAAAGQVDPTTGQPLPGAGSPMTGATPEGAPAATAVPEAAPAPGAPTSAIGGAVPLSPAVAAFEKQALALSRKKNEELLSLASDLLDAAHVSLI